MDMMRNNKTSLALSIFFLIITLFTSNSVFCKDIRYVSDFLTVSIRSGQEDDAVVLDYVQSNTPVEVLEENNTFLKIKTEEGLEGWIKKRYIKTEKPKSEIINNLKIEIEALKNKIVAFESSQSGSSGDISIMDIEYQDKISAFENTIKEKDNKVITIENDLKKYKSQTKKLIDKAKESQALENELDELKALNDSLTQEIKQMKTKGNTNPDFEMTRNIKWFLVGGGVMFFGFIIGLISRKKRSPYY